MSSTDGMGKSAPSYEYLKERLKKGLLRPGRHLSPGELARHFHVSATPIHDALLRLAAEGYLTWTASRGFFIKPFMVEEQREIFQLLRLSILPCLDIGNIDASRAQLEQFLALDAASAAEEPAGPEAAADRVALLVEGLYLATAQATGNQVLETLVRNHIDRTYLVRRLHMREADRRASVLKGLADTARALLGRDLCGALNVARYDLAELAARLPALVALANSNGLQSDFP